jgi:hypothetical protein
VIESQTPYGWHRADVARDRNIRADEERIKILTLCPSRGRPKGHREFANTYLANSEGLSEICFGLDDDDCLNYTTHQLTHRQVFYEVGERQRLIGTHNRLATKYALKYEIFCLTGDDTRIETPGFETMVIEAMAKMGGVGLVYGDDGIQHERLATCAFISANVVRKLGYAVLPSLVHVYCDNFVTDLFRAVGKITYLPDLKTTHHHYSVGKTPHDKTYEESDSFANQDKTTYTTYRYGQQFDNTVAKVRGLLK